jgi:hypothetical protein
VAALSDTVLGARSGVSRELLSRAVQIVEASCQRNYEGKGIWPSYVAHGIINGFPEQAINTNYTGGVKGLRDVLNASTVKGLWTWSRGDGNYGPYTKAGELWQYINCRVLSAWASDPARDEADVFVDTVGSDLALSKSDAQSLRYGLPPLPLTHTYSRACF